MNLNVKNITIYQTQRDEKSFILYPNGGGFDGLQSQCTGYDPQ